jgi:hypothetical protein
MCCATANFMWGGPHPPLQLLQSLLVRRLKTASCTSFQLLVTFRFLDVLGPGPLYVGCPSSDAITSHLAAASGAEVRNDVKVRGAAIPQVAQAADDASTHQQLLCL